MHIKRGFILMTTIFYSLLIFLIIGGFFTIISNNREDIKIEKKVNDNVNYFKNIDEIITNLNITQQDKIKYVLNKKKEKEITTKFKLSFNEEENCFYLILINKEEYKMKLIYKKEGENYILYPYFLK